MEWIDCRASERHQIRDQLAQRLPRTDLSSVSTTGSWRAAIGLLRRASRSRNSSMIVTASLGTRSRWCRAVSIWSVSIEIVSASASGDTRHLGSPPRHQGYSDQWPHSAAQGSSCGRQSGQATQRNGVEGFSVRFVGEDRGRTHYTGELWDLVHTTGTMDVVRMASPVPDMPAAYAAASSRGVGGNPAGRRTTAILEAQAMARQLSCQILAQVRRRSHGAGGTGEPHSGLPFPVRRRCRPCGGLATTVFHAGAQPGHDRPSWS